MNNLFKKDVVLLGAGCYGRHAYAKLKDSVHILNWVDNNEKLHGTQINGIEVIGIEELVKKNLDEISIVICTNVGIGLDYAKSVKVQIKNAIAAG